MTRRYLELLQLIEARSITEPVTLQEVQRVMLYDWHVRPQNAVKRLQHLERRGLVVMTPGPKPPHFPAHKMGGWTVRLTADGLEALVAHSGET